MAQTVINRNELFFGVNGEQARYQDAIITGLTDLVAGDVLVLATGKFRQAIDADLLLVNKGYRILLEDAAVSGGDVSAKTGVSGGIAKDGLVFTGAVLTDGEALRAQLQISSIYVQKMTNSMSVAGE